MSKDTAKNKALVVGDLMLDESIFGTASRLTPEGPVPVILKNKFPAAQSKYIRRLKCFGYGESSLQQLILDNCPDWPEEVHLGFRAGVPLLEIKLSVDDEEFLSLRNKCEEIIYKLLGPYIIGENDSTLSSIIVNLINKRNKKLTLAESCTGGYLSNLLTNVSGSSEVFKVGFVTYSNEFKNKLLNVNEVLFEEYGAVSSDVAISMAEGCLKSSGADFALSITGIAGPSGGSAEKPVGTVYIAISTKSGETQCIKKIYQTNRILFKEKVAMTALNLLRDYLFI